MDASIAILHDDIGTMCVAGSSHLVELEHVVHHCAGQIALVAILHEFHGAVLSIRNTTKS